MYGRPAKSQTFRDPDTRLLQQMAQRPEDLQELDQLIEDSSGRDSAISAIGEMGMRGLAAQPPPMSELSKNRAAAGMEGDDESAGIDRFDLEGDLSPEEMAAGESEGDSEEEIFGYPNDTREAGAARAAELPEDYWAEELP